MLALVAASCSGGDSDDTTSAQLTTLAPVTTTSAPSVPSSTPTTLAAATIPSPLNGLEVRGIDEENVERRVIAVKVDNHPEARPQSGLQDADAVYELLVEGGLTRFIAMFLQSDSEYVGPIRSVRPTDASLVLPLRATLQISGGQAWVKSATLAAGVPYIGETDPNTFRIPRDGRAYERTLFGTTEGMRERADRQELPDEPPVPWFTFGDAPAAPTRATEITMEWSGGNTVRWEHDGEQYKRFAGDEPHNWQDVDGNVDQISFDTVLVLLAERYTASPSGSQGGSSLPALETVGSGEALLLHDGVVVEGTWQRDDMAEPFALRTTGGTTMIVPPGRLWVSVFPSDGEIMWQ